MDHFHSDALNAGPYEQRLKRLPQNAIKHQEKGSQQVWNTISAAWNNGTGRKKNLRYILVYEAQKWTLALTNRELIILLEVGMEICVFTPSATKTISPYCATLAEAVRPLDETVEK